MSTAESVLTQIGKLISDAEIATGKSHDNLSDAVENLILGYGTGSGDGGGESDEYTGEDYTKTLSSVSNAIFVVSTEKKLVNHGDNAATNNVALGRRVSNGYGIYSTVDAIEIPSEAKKITVTFTDAKTEQAEILVIAGDKNNVTGSATTYMGELVDRKRSMDIAPGVYRYVVLNTYGAGHSVSSVASVANAKIRFD